MKNKQAKKMMANLCFHVCENQEVSWTTLIKLSANGTSMRFSRYMGVVDEPRMISGIESELRVLNISK